MAKSEANNTARPEESQQDANLRFRLVAAMDELNKLTAQADAILAFVTPQHERDAFSSKITANALWAARDIVGRIAEIHECLAARDEQEDGQ